jgi:hypothetical protein
VNLNCFVPRKDRRGQIMLLQARHYNRMTGLVDALRYQSSNHDLRFGQYLKLCRPRKTGARIQTV